MFTISATQHKRAAPERQQLNIYPHPQLSLIDHALHEINRDEQYGSGISAARRDEINSKTISLYAIEDPMFMQDSREFSTRRSGMESMNVIFGKYVITKQTRPKADVQ
jgi:hypothetical protein